MSCPECDAEDIGLGKCWACGHDARERPDNPVGAGNPTTGSRPPSEVHITLPWGVLPSDNLRTRRRGDADAREYRRKKEAMEAHMIDQAGPGRPLIPEADVAVRMLFYPPDARKRDVGNFTKGIEDAAEGIIFTDDYQIIRESWERHPPDEDARCELTVFRIEGAA